MPDPSRTNQATGTSTSATVTATFGFTATSGRLLLLVVGADDYRSGSPSGWTLSTGCSQEDYLGHYFWWKISNGTETSVQYTINSASKSAWLVREYDNIDPTPLDTSAGKTDYASYPTKYTTHTTSSITPSTGRRLVIASIGGAVDANVTSLSSWLNSYGDSQDSYNSGSGTRDVIGVATLLLDGNGSTSTSTGATYNVGVYSRTSMILSFKAAAASSASLVPNAAARLMSILLPNF